MNPRITPKERGLLKGAARRVFSRSDLRREVLNACALKGYHDPKRPRVTKWGICVHCRVPTPLYLMQVDHIEPIIPVDRSLEEMSWDEVIDRIWCVKENLAPLCKPCHTEKTKAERKQRLQHKRSRKSEQ